MCDTPTCIKPRTTLSHSQYTGDGGEGTGRIRGGGGGEGIGAMRESAVRGLMRADKGC